MHLENRVKEEHEEFKEARKQKSNELTNYASMIEFFLILVHKGCKIVENFFPVCFVVHTHQEGRWRLC